FNILEELAAERLQRSVLDRLTHQWAADSAWAGDFPLLYGELRWARSHDRPRAGDFPDAFVRLYNRVRDRRAGQLEDPASLVPARVEDLDAAVVDFQSTLAELADAATTQKTILANPEPAQACLRFGAALIAMLEREDWSSSLELADQLFERSSGRKGQADPVRNVRRCVTPDDKWFPNLRTALIDQVAIPHTRALARALCAFHGAYQIEKAQLGCLDFADLEQQFLTLLGDPAHDWLVEALRGRFRHVLVDEAQDTSPLQYQLVDRLSDGPDSERRQPIPFIVGDPKQSIYRFRGADLPAYIAFLGSTTPDRLRENYRAQTGILAVVNATLDGQPREPAPHEDADSAPVLFTPEARLITPAQYGRPPQTGPRVSFLDLELPREQLDGIDWRVEGIAQWTRDDVEAFALLAHLREAIARGVEVQQKGPGNTTFTVPLDWGQIACLVRASGSFAPLERAAKQLGIPYAVYAGTGLFAAPEVRDVLTFLQFLQRPTDDIACAAILRGPLVGLSVGGLLTLSQDRGRNQPLWPRVLEPAVHDQLSDGDRAACDRATALVSIAREALATCELPAVLGAIYETTGLADLALAQPDGLRRWGNLARLQELAAGFPLGPGESFQQFVDALEDYDERDVRLGEAIVEAPGQGALALLTIHAAKGEEYPVVAVPFLGRQFMQQADVWDFDDRHRLGVQLALGDNGQPTSALRGIRAAAKTAEACERHRLLYVALTRAQDWLVLSGAPGEGHGASWMKEYGDRWRALADCDEPSVQRIDTASALATIEAALQDTHGTTTETPVDPTDFAALTESLQQRFAHTTPPIDWTPAAVRVTDLVQFRRCAALDGFRTLGVPRLAHRADTPTGEDPLPRQLLGQVFHRVMEACDFADSTAFLTALPQHSHAAFDSLGLVARSRDLEEIARLVAGLFETSLMSSMLPQATHAWRELPLVWRTLEGLTLRGTIDLLLALEDGTFLLADYKTSAVADRVGDSLAEFIEKEGFQLACYRSAVADWLGVDPAQIQMALIVLSTVSAAAHVADIDPARYDIDGTIAAFHKSQQHPLWRSAPREWPEEAFTVRESCVVCAYHDGCPAIRRGETAARD
ncbi:MAG: UvrD-helicase domain-containing protein, partial [bacterium]